MTENLLDPDLGPGPRLAVTGATGQIGGMVARALAERGVPQRVLARRPERLPYLPGAVVFESSYDDRDRNRVALNGVRTLFMVSAAEDAERLDQHRAFIDAAARAGVEQIVYTSFFAAAPDATFTLARDHYATEQMIEDSGMAHTFLRDNFYLDVLLDFAGEDGVIRGPAGAGRFAGVARRDVADAATAVLLDPAAHRGRTYDLTGPQSLMMSEAAQILSEVTGRRIVFHDETVEEAYESRRRWEAPQWQYDAWVSTYTAIASGELAPVSPDVERLTGRPATPLARLFDSFDAGSEPPR